MFSEVSEDTSEVKRREQYQAESKWKNKIYKVAKVIDRIQILQLARFRNKRHRDMNQERWFQTKLKIRLKNSRNILGWL